MPITTNRKVQPFTLGRMALDEGGDLECKEYEWERYIEVCEELRKRRMDVCCLQEVSCRGQAL